MTDYLEELLDQLEEEDPGAAARWLDTLGPALTEPPGGAGLREPEYGTRGPVALAAADKLELSAPVQAEAKRVLAAPEDVENFLPYDPPEDWADACPPVPTEGETPETRIPDCQWETDWNVPKPDVLAEASGKGLERPALLEQAERLDRAVEWTWSGGAAVRAPGVEAGRTALTDWRGRRSGGWTERGDDPAAAVDRSFQRDSRRYDQGFALY